MLDSIKCVVVLPRFLRNYGPLRVCVKLELDNGQDLSHATFTTVTAMARFHASTWSVTWTTQRRSRYQTRHVHGEQLSIQVAQTPLHNVLGVIAAWSRLIILA